MQKLKISCKTCKRLVIKHNNNLKYCSVKCRNKFTYEKTKNDIYHRFHDFKRHAKRRHFEFTLSLGFVKLMWNKTCWYCGDKIRGLGIDRVNSLIGYTIHNVVPCCKYCNRMKSDQSVEQFLIRCNKILTKSECSYAEV